MMHKKKNQTSRNLDLKDNKGDKISGSENQQISYKNDTIGSLEGFVK